MDFWQGERVRLRAVEPADAETFYHWNRDSEMARHLDYVWPPTSMERARKLAEKTATDEPQNDGYFMVIENRAGEFVGTIDSHHCNRRAGTFMYGVAVRREHQRHGYASEAIRLLLRYFFRELRYQKVTVGVHSNNPASMALHERLGFLQEGRIRRAVYTEGQYFDEFYYGMTAEEFAQLPQPPSAAEAPGD